MNKETKQILESLQFLLSVQKPESEWYQEKQGDIMTKNHLLLNPIEDLPVAEQTADALKKELPVTICPLKHDTLKDEGVA